MFKIATECQGLWARPNNTPSHTPHLGLWLLKSQHWPGVLPCQEHPSKEHKLEAVCQKRAELDLALGFKLTKT